MNRKAVSVLQAITRSSRRRQLASSPRALELREKSPFIPPFSKGEDCRYYTAL